MTLVDRRRILWPWQNFGFGTSKSGGNASFWSPIQSYAPIFLRIPTIPKHPGLDLILCFPMKVLRNADELFKGKGSTDGNSAGFSPACFSFQPDRNVFYELLGNAMESDAPKQDFIIQKHFGGQGSRSAGRKPPMYAQASQVDTKNK